MSEGWKTCLFLWAWFAMLAAIGAVVVVPALVVTSWLGDGWFWMACLWSVLVTPPAVLCVAAAAGRLADWSER